MFLFCPTVATYKFKLTLILMEIQYSTKGLLLILKSLSMDRMEDMIKQISFFHLKRITQLLSSVTQMPLQAEVIARKSDQKLYYQYW